MKKIFSAFIALIAAVSCQKGANAVKTVTESLEASSGALTKVSLIDDVNAAWNSGDQVSVFYEGGSNELWQYNGPDGEMKGTITHEGSSDRVGTGRFVAMYPYYRSATISGDVITAVMPAVQDYKPSSFGWALMVSSTTGNNLAFKYASAFVRISLYGKGNVKSVMIKGNSNEVLAGPVSVDISGETPVATLTSTSGSKTLTLKKGYEVLEELGNSEKHFWLAMIPGTFENGFTITVTEDSGSAEEFPVSGPVTIKAGEVFCVHGFMMGLDNISVDFTSTTGIDPAFPKSITTSSGTHSFIYAGNTYSLEFHPVQYGTASYGYGMYEGTMLIGRNNSWIKLPVRQGYALTEVEFLSSGAGGSPYLSVSGTNPSEASNKLSSLSPGSTYCMTVTNPVKNRQYYLMVTSGNLRMQKLTMKYQKM